MSLLDYRAKIAKHKPLKEPTVHEEMQDIAQRLQAALKTAEIHELEDTPKDTVFTMLVNTKLDEIFTFKTSLGTGQKYVQAMRMVLSRARASAKKQKKQLNDFKLFEVEIVSEADHDVVKLVRSVKRTEFEESVYDEITQLFEKNPLKNNKRK